MGNTFYFAFEPALMEWIQSIMGDTGAKIVSGFSAFGEETVLILIMGFLYWCYDKKFGIYIGTNMVVGLTLNPLIKNIFLRRRPYMDNPGIKCLRPVEPKADIYDISAQGYSFPSGHSMNSAIAYGTLARYKRQRIFTILAFVIPLLVGISRVSVGVHYPTDVLTGWACGVVVIFAVPYINEKFGEANRWKVNLVYFLISCVGVFYCRTDDYFAGLGIMAGFFVGIEIEKRFVNFEGTMQPVHCILRLLGGLVLYLALNKLLKLPFSSEFLASGTMAAYIIRAIRYFLVLLFLIGIYPYVFRFFSGKKEAA
ncbi:phosphatase PAP2 family protein [Butyrivibrio sp. VCD2006]|uniref:phosphatase PAP2 family protein n=1 Tax=Butyrivibrio sp. VCD2006 TaxID=1280664 RepID=UPI000416C4DE|nr:phosphatase PAP2 family protein [Butyrivibrio sp. VCD2006]